MKRSTYIFLFTIFIELIFWNCSSNKDSYAEIIAEWQGREIVFPEKMTDVISGDTINLSNVDFIILTYVDTTLCTGCNLRLLMWKDFISSLDSISSDVDILNLIVVNAKDKRELLYLIKRDDYQFPVFNDINDTLYKTNNFYDDLSLRTFLLNKNKQVVAIGNPTVNNSVANLYRSIILGEKNFGTNGSQMISVENATVNIGNIKRHESYKYNYILRNEGVDSVVIKDIRSSCLCTTVNIEDSIIPPNASIRIQVTFSADSVIGNFFRSVQVFYLGFEYPTVLNISGTVIK